MFIHVKYFYAKTSFNILEIKVFNNQLQFIFKMLIKTERQMFSFEIQMGISQLFDRLNLFFGIKPLPKGQWEAYVR